MPPEYREPEPAAPAAELAVIGERLGSIDGAVQNFHERAEQYETIIRKMQSKIEDLQSDQVRTLLKPVIIRLADLYTEASAAAERAGDRGDIQVQKDFGIFADQIEEGLALLDIESLGTRVGDDFNSKNQAPRGTVTTDDPSLDRKVAQVNRQGFSYAAAERALLPSIVKVYRYAGDSAEPTATSAAPSVDNHVNSEGDGN
ncbi:MAG: nucleotide exchange factor GrpE [Gordonia amarae]